MRPLLQTLWLEIRSQFSEVASWFWGKRSLFMISLILFGLAAFFTVPHDKAWVRDVKALWPDGKAFARGVSFWGDYPFIGLIPGLGLGIFGFRSQKRNLARFGLALLLASSTAGLTTNLLRNSLGAPTHGKNARWPLWAIASVQVSRLPSGHAGAAFGAATFVAVALPPLGVPALGLASGIAWSRVYLRAHHPTDVAFGALFGIWAGVGFGLNYRRRKSDLRLCAKWARRAVSSSRSL